MHFMIYRLHKKMNMIQTSKVYMETYVPFLFNQNINDMNGGKNGEKRDRIRKRRNER